MTRITEEYPNIYRAGLEISYDNGGINRDRSENDFCKDLQKFIDNYPRKELLPSFDLFLGSLTKEELITLCAGDQDEARDIMIECSCDIGSLLNEIFEKVG